MGHIPSKYPTQSRPRHVDRLIAALAGAQHGVVALRQLVAFGLSSSAVRDRVAAGKLHRVHRGVYAVGHALLTKEGRYMAAVLAYAERTVLSHWSAADHLGLYWSARSVIDVMTPHRSGRSRPGLLVHRPRTLAPGDATTADGIPCTTWARTALDLAAAAQPRVIERVIERAESLRIYDERALDALLERNPMHRGARTLRSVVDRLGDPVATKNDLEEAFFRLCDNARIPRPLVNQWIHLDDGGNPVEADFMWPEHGVIVEVDGWATHGTRAAFERDREKDVRLELADWTVVRFTWREVTRNPARVARRVAGLLSRRRRLAA